MRWKARQSLCLHLSRTVVNRNRSARINAPFCAPKKEAPTGSALRHSRGYLFCSWFASSPSPSLRSLCSTPITALPRSNGRSSSYPPGSSSPLRGVNSGSHHGQVSLVHTARPSMHSVTKPLTRSVIASMLPAQRDRLPDPPPLDSFVDQVWTSPFIRRLVATCGRIAFVILRTACSPPVAPHPASRRCSYLRLPRAASPGGGLSPLKSRPLPGARIIPFAGMTTLYPANTSATFRCSLISDEQEAGGLQKSFHSLSIFLFRNRGGIPWLFPFPLSQIFCLQLPF
jgi:hypothetical protein